MLISVDEFLSMRHHLPVVDVRSEGEFAAGHIPGVRNIPILNDNERKAVGTDYKTKGQLEAIKTGFRLVGPRILELIEQAERVATEREMIVHCWRGGMRSGNFCHFMSMARIRTHQLTGGYKAYRQRVLESFAQPFRFVVISGGTGSGKTDVLRALKARGEQIIDLEQLASHKGSVFGGMLMPPQPTTEQFQNDLFESILKLDPSRRIWIEDESIAVGKIFLPEALWRTKGAAPIVELIVEKETRIQRLVDEYGPAPADIFLENMEKIKKKLGGQHFNTAREKLLEGSVAATIDILLNYYDKAYANGLSKKEHRIIGRVEWDGVHADSAAANLLGAVADSLV